MADELLNFGYKFTFDDGKTVDFKYAVNPDTMGLIHEPMQSYPAWTALDFNKCPNCPLDSRLEKRCPAALSLVPAVSFFSESISYERTRVEVTGPDRQYSKDVSLQEGLSAMVGLCMATSGCPIMEKLKPLARFHMPFATADETAFRVMSMYLFAQYLRFKRGSSPDWEMKYLDTMYDSIRTVNKGIVTRLQNIKVKDASLNALISLDCFAISVKFSINLDAIEDVEKLFVGYMG